MRSDLKSKYRETSVLDIPVERRIVEAASTLFMHYGFRASTLAIAHFGHTNVDTVVKHFGSQERLVSDFLKNQMKDIEASWQEIERECPGDPELQLRQWILNVEIASDDRQTPGCLLSRAAAELFSFRKGPILSEIETFWQAERRRIQKICVAAKFQDPSKLADKLLLLVHGAFNERQAYGYDGPHGRLAEAGDDLMVAHGAQRKPLLEVY